jgi:hypothetical protein
VNSADRTRAVQDWIVDTVVGIVDNAERWYVDVRAAAKDAVRFDAGVPSTWGQYAEAHRVSDVHTYADIAGLRIVDVFREAVQDGVHDGNMRLLVEALLDFSDREQWRRIGDYYLPQPDDWEESERW